MEWYREIQFVSAVPMPEEMADEFGTTVNGMWADADGVTESTAPTTHEAGRFALFSVPLIALVPQVYEDPETSHLLDSVCSDVDGGQAEATWYYWEPKPVYSACIYSEPFRSYLLDLCKRAVDLGMDVVNLDEIMCHTGLMSRGPKGSGFCALCLGRFRASLDEGSELAPLDDESLRAALRSDDDLYDRYHRFQEHETFHVMVALIDDLRAHAQAINPGFAISANVAYMGNKVGVYGPLWSGIWAQHLDFVLMENDYRIEQHQDHLILPRGKFVAWYRLASADGGAPTWICPSIHVPRQLAEEDRRRYYELMFVESYANAGRWGYYWWPGVDAETRRRATAPDTIKEHIGFIDTNRSLLEGATTSNETAILYLEGPMLRRPGAHEKYLALAQALYESGLQYDVVYAGDGIFNPEEIEPGTLERYRAILVPEAGGAGPAAVAALGARIADGVSVVVFSESPLEGARHEDGDLLARYWREYDPADLDRIAAIADEVARDRILVSNPSVAPVRYLSDGRQVIHLVNYGYQPDTDVIEPAEGLTVRIPGGVRASTPVLLDGGGDHQVRANLDGDDLVMEVPRLDAYALLVV